MGTESFSATCWINISCGLPFLWYTLFFVEIFKEVERRCQVAVKVRDELRRLQTVMKMSRKIRVTISLLLRCVVLYCSRKILISLLV